MDRELFVRVAILDNEVEARLLSSILEDMHIPHRIISYHDTAYDGLFQVQRGWGAVAAHEDHSENVVDILEGIRTQRVSVDDEGSSEAES